MTEIQMGEIGCSVLKYKENYGVSLIFFEKRKYVREKVTRDHPLAENI